MALMRLYIAVEVVAAVTADVVVVVADNPTAKRARKERERDTTSRAGCVVFVVREANT